MDMDKIEGGCPLPEEVKAVQKCYAHLEGEKPVCDMEMNEAEREFINGFGLLSFKPTVMFDEAPSTDTVCEAVARELDVLLHSRQKEVRAWFVEKKTTRFMRRKNART